MWGEDASNLPTIPLQKRVTLQILNYFSPFKDLKETFAVSHRAEQLCLSTKLYRSIVATVQDSVLCTEMENLESQEEDPGCPGSYTGPLVYPNELAGTDQVSSQI